MPRRKKNEIKNQTTAQPAQPESNLIDRSEPVLNPNPLNASDTDSAANLNAVEVEIEQHNQPKEGIFSQFLRRASQDDSDSEGIDPGPAKKQNTYTAPKDAIQISNLFTSVLVLALGLSKIPQDVHPNEDELGGISYHATAILLRHFPIKGKLSRDALDMIGMFSIMAAWYARVAPRVNEYRAQAIQAARSRTPIPQDNRRPQAPDETESPYPVDPLSPFYRSPNGNPG